MTKLEKRVLPPGTILHQLFLKERFKKISPGFFIEVGCGHGVTSRLLLALGWKGVAYELNEESSIIAIRNNQEFVDQGSFKVFTTDFLDQNFDYKADLVLSNMVIEHLSNEQEKKYFLKCRQAISKDGKILFSVPAGMKYWNIEDEIAGHFRRYSREEIKSKLSLNGFKLDILKGLTYPLSNSVLWLSNMLIRKQEAYKLKMNMRNKTILSGNRKVRFKTEYPQWMKIILNELTLYPFHIIQKVFSNHKNALILYAEAHIK